MKVRAVIEVSAVFAATWLILALTALSPVGEWERQTTGPFNFIEYTLIIIITLLVMVATRRNLASYGVSFRNLRYHLDIAVTAFLPVALGYIPIALIGDNHKTLWGALIMSGVQVAVLFLLGWILERKPTRNESAIIAGALLLLAFSNLTQRAPLDNPLSGFIYYLLFVGFGEELLFRGYIQSRLNEAWGRPFQFYGVPWGWGLIITSVIFGLMHVINIGSLVNGNWQLAPWWGLWTFFGGLVLGFVREKSGSIVAPSILHGLPQAISTAFGF